MTEISLAARAGTPAADSVPGAEPNVFARAFHFVDGLFGSRLGGALLGLIFTTILGGGISACISQYGADRVSEKSRLSTERDARASLLASVSTVLVDRRVALMRLRYAMMHNASAADIKERWSSYQDAYLAYHRRGFLFRSDLVNLLGAKEGLQYTRVLGNSLDTDFSMLDGCISDAYYAQSRGKGSAAARAILGACPDDEGRPRGDANTALNHLGTCVATFETELVWSMYLRNRASNAEPQVRALSTVLIGGPAPGPVKGVCTEYNGRTNWSCLEKLETSVLPGKFAKACGPVKPAAPAAPKLPILKFQAPPPA
jgi:hypothetical protein